MAMFVSDPKNSGSSGGSRRGIFRIDTALAPMAEDLGVTVPELGNLIGAPIHGNEAGTSAELYLEDNLHAIKNLYQVVERGRQVWGKDYKKFVAWLHSPLRPLSGKKPIAVLNSEEGIQNVLKIIGQIEHGVYS